MGYNPWPKTQSTTVAGRSGRSTDTGVQAQKTRKHYPPRLGVIVAVAKKAGVTPLPFVKVRWIDDPERISGWIRLEEHPMSMGFMYASRLEDLVGQYTVKVYYHNPNSKAGVAKIVPDTKIDPEMYDPQLESTGVKIV